MIEEKRREERCYEIEVELSSNCLHIEIQSRFTFAYLRYFRYSTLGVSGRAEALKAVHVTSDSGKG